MPDTAHLNASDAAPLITVLQHEPAVPLDRLGEWLDAAGADVQVRQLWREQVPSVDEVGDGLVSLGFRGSVEERTPWREAEMALLADAVEREVPTLGICFGHQLLAVATGGRVEVGHSAGPEFGAVRLMFEPAAGADPVFGRVARLARAIAPSAHADAVTELPPGAVLLAGTDRYAVHAMRVGSAVGVQFHPEASPGLLEEWAGLAGLDRVGTRAEMDAVDAACARLGRAIASGFVNSILARAVASAASTLSAASSASVRTAASAAPEPSSISK